MAAIYNGKEEKSSSVLTRAQITSVSMGIAAKVAVMCRTHSALTESVSRDARQRSELEGKGKKEIFPSFVMTVRVKDEEAPGLISGRGFV